MPLPPESDRTKEYLALLRERVPEKTVRHSISVSIWAEVVADSSGADRGKASTAALLHDLEKGLGGKELLKMAKDMGLDISETQREKPKLLHGFVAAEECRRLLGIEDEEVLDAIRWHTTGLPGLGPAGLVLYFADFSEPLREYPEAAEARRIFEADGLHEALCFVAAAKLEYARRKPPLDPNTEAFGNWLHRIPMLPGVGG